jgi:hypothetical protein
MGECDQLRKAATCSDIADGVAREIKKYARKYM